MDALYWGLLGAALVAMAIAMWAFHRGHDWIHAAFRILTHILSGGASLGMFDQPKKKPGEDHPRGE